jgi:hypothetical protein
LTNVVEQELEIGGQRIAGLMKVPHHLVQIISEPYELGIDEAPGVALVPGVAFAAHGNEIAMLIEKKGATEVNGTHAKARCAPLDAFKLACCEAQIELLGTWLGFFRPPHDFCPWQSACVLGFGDYLRGPQRDPFA